MDLMDIGDGSESSILRVAHRHVADRGCPLEGSCPVTIRKI